MNILTSPQTSYTTSPNPPSQLMTLPYNIWRKWSNQIKTSSWPSADLEPSCICIYTIWLCPVSMGGVSLFLSWLTLELLLWIPSLAFSRMLLLQLSPFLLHHCFSLCSESSPPAYKHFLASPVLLPFFSALIHSTNSWVVYRHPAPSFTFPSCSNWALPSSFSFDFDVAKSNSQASTAILLDCTAIFDMVSVLFFLKCLFSWLLWHSPFLVFLVFHCLLLCLFACSFTSDHKSKCWHGLPLYLVPRLNISSIY